MEPNKIKTKEQAERSFKELEQFELKIINLKIGELERIVVETRDSFLKTEITISELRALRDRIKQYIFEFTELELAPEYKPRIHFSDKKTKSEYLDKWEKRMRETVMRLKSYLPVIESKMESYEGEGSALSYERLFKDEKECIRITALILDQACTNEKFTGFKDVTGSPKNQIKIAYQIVRDRFMKPIYTETKGSIQDSRKLFFERFGGENFFNPKKPRPNDSKTNNQAKRDLELILK